MEKSVKNWITISHTACNFIVAKQPVNLHTQFADTFGLIDFEIIEDKVLTQIFLQSSFILLVCAMGMTSFRRQNVGMIACTNLIAFQNSSKLLFQ